MKWTTTSSGIAVSDDEGGPFDARTECKCRTMKLLIRARTVGMRGVDEGFIRSSCALAGWVATILLCVVCTILMAASQGTMEKGGGGCT
jgi:hypothetical protein